MSPELAAEDDARDLADCRPSSVVKLAAGTMAFSGVGSCMLALQSLLLVGPSRAALPSFAFGAEALFGALLLGMAMQLLKMRLWATLAAAALSFFTALAMLAWNSFALSHGLFSLL